MLAKLTDEGTSTSENLVRWMRAKKSSPFEVTIGQKALNSFQKAWRLFKTAVPSKLPFIWQTATIGKGFFHYFYSCGFKVDELPGFDLPLKTRYFSSKDIIKNAM